MNLCKYVHSALLTDMTIAIKFVKPSATLDKITEIVSFITVYRIINYEF